VRTYGTINPMTRTQRTKSSVVSGEAVTLHPTPPPCPPSHEYAAVDPPMTIATARQITVKSFIRHLQPQDSDWGIMTHCAGKHTQSGAVSWFHAIGIRDRCGPGYRKEIVATLSSPLYYLPVERNRRRAR
jgi:hypothetical protein